MKYRALLLLIFLSLKINAQQLDFAHIDFTKVDSVANIYKNSKLTNLPQLSHRLTFRFHTDVEKFRAIYMWVCNNIESDYDFSRQNLKKRKKLKSDNIALYNWNNSFKTKVFKRLIKDQKTICTGYAYLIKELSFFAGINCVIVDGYGRTLDTNIGELSVPNHSWNAVELEGKWYLCDATWASGLIINIADNTFIKNYNDGYFLTEPELFIKSHYPLDEKWSLLNNTLYTTKQFVNSPVVYGDTFKHLIIPVAPKLMNNKILLNQDLNFKLKLANKTQIDKLTITISNGWKAKTFKLLNYTYKDGVIQFEHSFFKKGLYDLHLKINNNVIATYTIDVKKVS